MKKRKPKDIFAGKHYPIQATVRQIGNVERRSRLTLEHHGFSEEDRYNLTKLETADPVVRDSNEILKCAALLRPALEGPTPDPNYYRRFDWTTAFEIGYSMGAAVQRAMVRGWYEDRRQDSRTGQARTTTKRLKKSARARERARSLLEKRRTVQQVAGQLAREGFVNPSTKIAYSEKTVGRWAGKNT